MTTDNHTPIAVGAPANSAVINAPLSQLDAAIGKLSTLTTTAKGSLVGAINEVDGGLETLSVRVAVSHDTDGTLKVGAVDQSDVLANHVVTTVKVADANITPAKLSQSLEAINLTPRWMSHSRYAWEWTGGEPEEDWGNGGVIEGGLLLTVGETIYRRYPIGQVGRAGDALYVECAFRCTSSASLRIAISQRNESDAILDEQFSSHASITRAIASETATLVSGTVYVVVSFQAVRSTVRVGSMRFGKNGNSKSTWIDDPNQPDPALLLPGIAAKVRMRQNIHVLARGTSITEGAAVGGSVADTWFPQLLNQMKQYYPTANFVGINNGASSCNQIYDCVWNRLNNGLVSPDLFLLEVSHNSLQTPGTNNAQVFALDGLIQNTMQRYPHADVALTIMNPSWQYANSTLWHDRTQAGRMLAQHYGLYLGDTLKEAIRLAVTGFDIKLLSEATEGGSHEHPNLLGNDFIDFCLRPMFLFGNSMGVGGPNRGASAFGPVTNAFKYSRWYEADETDLLGAEFFVETVGSWTETAITLKDALRPSVRWHSNVTGHTLTFRYYGYGYQLLMEQGSSIGVATITTDGVVDSYNGYQGGAITVHRVGRYVNKMELGLGWHVVTVAVSGTKSSSSSGFEVGCAGAYVMGVPGYVVDDDSLAVTYVGAGWSTVADANAYGGNYRSNPGTDTTQYVELDFIGTGVVLIAKTENNLGIADVLVDGLDSGTNLDLYRSDVTEQNRVAVVSNLPYGRHTLRLRNTNSKNGSSSAFAIRIDGFMVLDERSFVGQVVEGVAGVGDMIGLVGYFAQYDTPSIAVTSEGSGNIRLGTQPTFQGFTLAGDSGVKGVFRFAAM